LGIKDGNRLPLEKVESGKAMPETYFSAPGWRGFLYLIGVADSGDSHCLRSSTEIQDSLVTAFEEYANQGLHILRNRLQLSSSSLDEVASMMLEAIRPEASRPIVEDLI
jgi:dnd system-associated protein 4